MQTLLSIGNFDGVHRGHQKLIERLLEIKQSLQGESRLLTLTFEPHPVEVLRPGTEVDRLTPPELKTQFLKAAGVDQVVLENFDLKMAAMSPQDFFQKILVEKLAGTHIAVGEDFKFGARQSGDVELLKKLSQAKGIQVLVIRKFTEAGEVISSSRIRQLISEGQVQAAGLLLGRPYRMLGTVVHGAKRGTTIGVPTANLQITHSVKKCAQPKVGVYVTRTYIENAGPGLLSLTNVGYRPTVEANSKALSIETHVLSPVGDLYGKTMSVEILDRIRDEKRFGSLDELKLQIQSDIRFTQSYLP